MPTQATQDDIERIGAALADGQKIQAIKIYREATGHDLKAAKEFVEALMKELLEKEPEKYAKLATQGKGCASVILVALSVSGMTYCCVRALVG